MSCEILSKLDDDVVKNIHGLCSLHQGWFFNSQYRSNMTTLTLNFFSSVKGEELITVGGQRLTFKLNIILYPRPKLTPQVAQRLVLSTYGHAIPIEDIIRSDKSQLSLRTIDNVMRLVESTVPCLRILFRREQTPSFLKYHFYTQKISLFIRATFESKRD